MDSEKPECNYLVPVREENQTNFSQDHTLFKMLGCKHGIASIMLDIGSTD